MGWTARWAGEPCQILSLPAAQHLKHKGGSCNMDLHMAKKQKVLYVKGEGTSNPVLLAEGWYLDPNEDSQVLVPPDTPAIEDEERAEAEESAEAQEIDSKMEHPEQN